MNKSQAQRLLGKTIDLNKKTLIVGASAKPERYSNKAIKMLIEEGHEVVALSRKPDSAHGIEFVTTFDNIENIDTVTLYIRPEHQTNIIDKIIALNPKRVIFNPGTENVEFANVLKKEGIVLENACTLVLLRIGAY